MANIACFNVNIYAIEVEMNPNEVFLDKGKYCIEFNFDDFRIMRTSASKDFKWPKEYLHIKYTTEYPQHLSLKDLTVRLVRPSVLGFSDHYHLNPVTIDLSTIATGLLRYKAELATGFVVSFILEMAQVSDVSIELRNLRYTITDRTSFPPGEYVAVVVYEPGSGTACAQEIRSFVDANLAGEENEAYRERKEDELAALQEQKSLTRRARVPAVMGSEGSGALEWPAISRIVVKGVSFRDLYHSSLYIGIKRLYEDRSVGETHFTRCTRIPISRCLVHRDVGENDRREGSFPGDEDKIVHLTGALEGSIYLNDIPYYSQVIGKVLVLASLSVK